MTAAKATGATNDALIPRDVWDTDSFDNATTRAYSAGFVAWSVLAHSQGLGPDLVRITNMALPAGCDSEDMASFLWELVTSAGEIGFAAAMINTDGMRADYPKPTWISVEDVGRAAAALLRYDVVDDGEPFDLEYRAKIDAASRKAAAA